MKCKDCCASGADICLVGMKSRMLVCGHYGCDLQRRVVERRMGIEKPKTNYDLVIRKTPEELAEWIGETIDCQVCKTMHHSENNECPCKTHQACADFWLDWLRQEEE